MAASPRNHFAIFDRDPKHSRQIALERDLELIALVVSG
jgi:hypothetical protein